MPKRKHGEVEEDSLETGNVDQGDFSDGDDSGEENDAENVDKYEMMKEDDIEGDSGFLKSYIYCQYIIIPVRPRGPYPRI